LLVYQIYIFQ